jgi:Tol biopolymer transport system component
MKARKCVPLLLFSLVLAACHVLGSEERETNLLRRSPNRRYALVTIADHNEKNTAVSGDHICVVDLAGSSAPFRLENAIASEFPLAVWSPDSQRLAFVSGPGLTESLDIYVLSVETRQLLRLSQLGGSSLSPVWSPDGHRLAFLWRDATWDPNGMTWAGGDIKAIYVVNVDGSGLHELTRSDGSVFSNPVWLPDGRKLLFLGGSDLYLADVDAAHVNRLTASLAGRVSSYAVSPDGEHIAFAVEPDDDGNNGVFIVDNNGRELKQIKAIGASEANEINSLDMIYSNIYWAPDGSRFAFWLLAPPQEPSTVFVAEPDETEVLEFFDRGRSSSPTSVAWASDSRRILVSGSRYPLYIADTTAGVITPIRSGTEFDSVNGAKWSPDGRWIIAQIYSESGDSIFAIDPEDGELSLIKALPDHISQLVWLPDGEHLAFFEVSEGKPPIEKTVDLDGMTKDKSLIDCK